MSREREIEQGLREPGGGLVGGLDVLEYGAGWRNYEDGVAPPGVTGRDYDLGRARAAEYRDARAEVLDKLRRDQEASHLRVLEALEDRPNLADEYRARIAAIRSA